MPFNAVICLVLLTSIRSPVALQLLSGTNIKWQPKLSGCLRGVCQLIILPSILLGANLPTGAIEGSAPKLEYFSTSDDTSSGPRIYGEADAKIISDKIETIEKTFNKMTNKIETAIVKNSKPVAKNAMEIAMADLKMNMRLVAKVASKGDIFVREKVDAEANFDYNSGKFEYKPEAQYVEDVISKLNQLYFYGLDSSKEIALQDLAETKNTFNQWSNLIEKRLGEKK